MGKEADIKELYERGWWPDGVEPRPRTDTYPTPDWAKNLHWNYSLWSPPPDWSREEALDHYCRSFLGVLPDKEIFGADGSPYLSRYCIAEPRGAAPEDLSGKIYLNHFHRGDEDLELHNHPWDDSLSLILINGYDEERRMGQSSRWGWRIRRRRYVPGDLVPIEADTFHRVDVPRGEAWTLFFTGQYRQTWHFWDRVTGVLTPWSDFVKAKGLRSI